MPTEPPTPENAVPRGRRHGAAALASLALFALWTSPCWGLPLFCAGYPALLAWANSTRFGSEKWKATADSSARYDMSWDLLYREVLTGKTPEEVEGLLGKPDHSETSKASGLPDHDPAEAAPGTEVWYYNLGGEKYEFQLGPSGALLAVDFRSGVVVRVWKVVH